MGKKVAAGTPDKEPRRLVFFKEDIARITTTLVTLLKNAQARGVLLVDKDGHLLTKEGESPTHDMDQISALVAGSFAATKQMARLLGEENLSVMFHQDGKDYIELSLVGERTLLAVIFDDQTTLGMVRLYAGQASARLTELFNDIANRGNQGPDSFDGTGPSPAPA